MMLPPGTCVRLRTTHTDMRCGFDSLAGIVRSAKLGDPLDGTLYVFRNLVSLENVHMVGGGAKKGRKTSENTARGKLAGINLTKPPPGIDSEHNPMCRRTLAGEPNSFWKWMHGHVDSRTDQDGIQSHADARWTGFDAGGDGGDCWDEHLGWDGDGGTSDAGRARL